MRKWTCGIPVLTLLLLTGCATSNYTFFQNGKPSGKENGSGGVALSVGSSVDYEVQDEAGQPPRISIGPDILPAPVIAIQGNGGVSDHVDIGGGLGISFFSVNLGVFSKLALFNSEDPFGAALMPSVGFSFTPDTLFGFFGMDRTVLNTNFYLSLPMSYDLDEHFTVFIRPQYGFEYSRLSVKDDDAEEEDGSIHKGYYFQGRGISAGCFLRGKNPNSYVAPSVSFISFDDGIHYMPFVGIMFSADFMKSIFGDKAVEVHPVTDK